MKLKPLSCSVVLLSAALTLSPVFAAQTQIINEQTQIAGFSIIPKTDHTIRALTRDAQPQTDTLVEFKPNRYQQYYQGVKVIGGEVVKSESPQVTTSLALAKQDKPAYNGAVVEGITLSSESLQSLSTELALQSAYDAAVLLFKNQNTVIDWQIKPISQDLVIAEVDGKAMPLHEVHFYAQAQNETPKEMFYYLDVKNPTHVVKSWDNTKHLSDTAPGGNQKTGKYVYGENGIPSLDVKSEQGRCVLENDDVRVVNIKEQPKLDRNGNNFYKTAFSYPCGSLLELESVNGGFSPEADAYYYGQVIVDMYKKWYSKEALPKQTIPQLMMRVHHPDPEMPKSGYYGNAFWSDYTNTMNFGDGDPTDMYPLVSLDVAGHEVSHGFTSNHSNLAYHDQSGSINEAFSDMAGIAAQAYLLETQPEMYQRVNGTNQMDWKIGHTVMKSSDALRYMDEPAKDRLSAECFTSVDSCDITYDTVVKKSGGSQGYIVHLGSGVYNKAFYVLATTPNWDVKKAFAVMIYANEHYWTSGGLFQKNFFSDSAQGVVKAADALGYDKQAVIDAFTAVGVTV